MAKPALNTLTATLAGATVFGLVVTSQPAAAATLTYDFTVNVTSGSNVGKYTGNFSFDPSTPLYKCDIDSLYYCANPTTNNLKVSFNFLGATYTETDDKDYTIGGNFPSVYFQLNQANQLVLNGLSFLVLPPTAPTGFFILGNEFQTGNTPENNPYEGTLVGNVSYAVRIPTPPPGPPSCQATNTCSAVPEPSEIAGSALAIALLGVVHFRRRSRAAKLKN